MAINDPWNKRCGPGGSARRLHHHPERCGERGRNRLDTRGKDVSFARHGSAVIGPYHKCQRQQRNGARCLTSFRQARSGGHRATEAPHSLRRVGSKARGLRPPRPPTKGEPLEPVHLGEGIGKGWLRCGGIGPGSHPFPMPSLNGCVPRAQFFEEGLWWGSRGQSPLAFLATGLANAVWVMTMKGLWNG